MLDDADVTWLAVTLMPDHAHLLFQLGHRLSLPRAMAKWRSNVGRKLSIQWQANFFEHRLRDHEDVERYAWYMFMNPYRARLAALNTPWGGWWTAGTHWDFLMSARPGPCPQLEWLERFESVARTLVTGENHRDGNQRES